MKSIYISGQITGIKDGNVEAFSEAVRIIYRYADPVNPHFVCANVPRGSRWTVYMRLCVEALTRCDGIFMLSGWWRSKGARWELIIAWMLGLRIYFTEKQLQRRPIQ